MQVILLAAGTSSRLDPIADKNTLEFNGKPLIEHQVALLKKAKMRDIAVVAGAHNIKKITAILKKFSNVAVTEQKKLEDGMAGGVLAGAKLIGHKNVLVMSTNDVFDPDLFEKLIQTSKTKGIDGVIAGKKMENYFPGGYLKMDKNDCITDIIEKPKEGSEPSKFVNLVCHIYNDFPAFEKYLKASKAKADGRYEDALDKYIKKGGAKMLAYKYTGFWQPIKFPWDIIKLMNYYLETQTPRISKKADIAKTAIIEGNVIIEDGVKVFHNAVIQGPAYIGENAIVANNALVRGSSIGRNCVVGFATEVARSYLNHDVWMHSNYIGDSMIDENVSFGAGTILGNLRFDEAEIKVTIKGKRVSSGTNKLGAIIGSGVRMGINSTTNPGVKIGQNTFIGGNVHLEKDVPDNKIVIAEQKLKMLDNTQSVSMKARENMKKQLNSK